MIGSKSITEPICILVKHKSRMGEKMKKYFYFIMVMVIGLMSSPVFAGTFNLEVGGGYASVTGYMQTPAGGKHGTSDINRPTFKELGIDEVTIKDISMSWDNDDWIIYSSINIMDMKTEGVFREDLMCRTLFNKSDSFTSEFYFNRYTIGSGYKLPNLNGFLIVPRLELQFLSFGLEIESANAWMERSYMKPSLGAGIDIYRPIIKDIVVYGKLSTSVPISNTPDNIEFLGGVKKTFSDTFTLSTEVRVIHIDYEDNQPLPNHLRLETKPTFMLKVGYIF